MSKELKGARFNAVEAVYGTGDPDMDFTNNIEVKNQLRMIYKGDKPVGKVIVTSTVADIDSGSNFKDLWDDHNRDK